MELVSGIRRRWDNALQVDIQNLPGCYDAGQIAAAAANLCDLGGTGCMPSPSLEAPTKESPLGDNSTFGEVGVVDDVLCAVADPSSAEVGRYQWPFAGADANCFAAITLVFTAGEHRGSTLGKYSFPGGGDVLERAVVGGTGGLRMARGFSLLKVVSTPPEAAVFQLHLFVFTPRCH
ncbi:hypothetical protein U9M48_035074 [Paspalum notatum var. saurae]|uniref:Dirigent protein n=1 Tax=Paspalum notatum var. saurae TaxID=547442 RepID=A0AAQ3UFC1_PASNO